MANRLLAVARLQLRARKKLGDDCIWWVTERSLQQATPWQVAGIKASWFGSETVCDLCCGIGGDAISLARRGPLIAVDRDHELIEMAAANLAPYNDAKTVLGDVLKFSCPAGAAIHIDPDRRVGDRRTTTPDHYQPHWRDVLRLTEQADAAVIKLAPAARPDLSLTSVAHRCWISLRGSVREQSVLMGNVVRSAGFVVGARSSVMIRSNGEACRFAPSSDSNEEPPRVDRPQAMLVDPDAAIRAAGLTDSFAREFALSLLGGPAGFLTGGDDAMIRDEARLTNMAVVGRVVWIGSCDDRKLRRELRQRNAFPIAIKVRGTDHDPAMLLKRYRGCGDHPVTLWIGRTGRGGYAAITYTSYQQKMHDSARLFPT